MTEEDEPLIRDGGAVGEEDDDALLRGDVGDVAGAILAGGSALVDGERFGQPCEHGCPHPVVECHGQRQPGAELTGGAGGVRRDVHLGRRGRVARRENEDGAQERGNDAVENALRGGSHKCTLWHAPSQRVLPAWREPLT